MFNEKMRAELRATRALYIQSHPELYTPEVVAEAQKPFEIQNPKRGAEGEPDTLTVEASDVEITHPPFRDALGLPPIGQEVAPAAEPSSIDESNEPAAEPLAGPAPDETIEPQAPKLASRKKKSGR